MATEIAALRLLGVAHPETHLVVLQQGMWVNVLLTRRALSQDDVARVVRAVTDATTRTDRVHMPCGEAMGFSLADRMQVLYAPGFPGSDMFSVLLKAAAVGQEQAVLDKLVFNGLALNFSPVTDSRPFFFQFLRARQLGAVLGASGNGSPVNYATNYYTRGLRAYLGSLAVIALVAAALILLPLAVAKRRGLWGAAPARALGYSQRSAWVTSSSNSR